MTSRIRIAALAIGLSAIGATMATAQEAQPTVEPTTGPSAQPTTAPAPETVVAVINGTKITRADVVASAASLPAQYQQHIEELFPALIDRLVDLTLLSNEGRKQNLQDDAEVKARVANFADQVIQEVVIRRYIDKLMTEEAIKARYDRFVAEQPVEIRASHILVATEEEAREIIRQLESGADFTTLARERSTDPTAQQNGGDLGYFIAEDMVPEFSRAAFALEKGENSKEPVKSQFGWHVIKAMDKRARTAPPFEESREHMKELLSSELLTEYVTSLRAAATIERFNPDGTPIAAMPATGSGEQPQP
jgi:peptidyl-prolyl cis-trans isomerase C